MRERHDCRLCGGALRQVFSLRPSAVANSFPSEPDAGAERIPLDPRNSLLWFPGDCGACPSVRARAAADGRMPEKVAALRGGLS